MDEEIVEVPGAEAEVVDYTELLTSIDEKMELLQAISTSLLWIFVTIFFIVGLILMHLFFIGKGDKG